MAISKSMAWYIVVWVIGGTACVIMLLAYGKTYLVLLLNLFYYLGILWYGSEYRGWGTAITLGTKMAKAFSYTRLLWNVLTLHAPIQDEGDLASNPVRFVTSRLIIDKVVLASSLPTITGYLPSEASRPWPKY